MRSRIGRGSSPLGDDSDLGKALCACGVGMEEISTLRLTHDHRMFF
uniref:Uncharacterized protein n=1 Tax=Brassica oleracea TaxID=3712 RepID=A0A3P6BIK8_BRAOL|nr:unnamed protein product [Brassica oleracea]